MIIVSNSLDTDQVGWFVGPGLCLKCLQKLSADGTSKPRYYLCVLVPSAII